MLNVDAWRHKGLERVALAGSVLAFGLGLSALDAQVRLPATQPRPTYRAEINYVEITVRAVNGRGEFVGDLKQSDFQVREDGRLQTITTFALVKAQGVPAERKSPEPPVTPSAPTEIEVADRQVYLFVLDDLHVRPDFSVNARRIGQRFIDAHMSAGDVAGVVFTSGVASQDLTTDRASLQRAFDRLIGEWDPRSSVTPLWYEGLIVSKALANLCDWLARIPGRHKAIIFVSSGLGCNLGYVDAREKSEEVGLCRDAVLDAVDAATRGNVSIYSIDPQSMAAGSAERALSDAPMSSGGGSPVHSVTKAQVPGPIHGIRSVAEMTGGFFELGATRLDRFLGRVVRENSAYYLIGYYSSNASTVTARTVRTNEIKIARRGVTAYYRRQYAIVPQIK